MNARLDQRQAFEQLGLGFRHPRRRHAIQALYAVDQHRLHQVAQAQQRAIDLEHGVHHRVPLFDLAIQPAAHMHAHAVELFFQFQHLGASVVSLL